jgi:cell division protein FtsL
MTPPAATAAGRALPRTAVPRTPRRVSGPARPAPRPKRAGAGPATGRRHAGAATAADPLAVRALRRCRLLADSRLLDRLVRGQLWIPLVAVGLMGIVFMQVSMLKLNAGIGRAVQTASTLERQNSNLRSDVSRMESGERIDSVAHGLGMVVPADGGENYVRAGASDTAARAAQRMTSADPDALARAQAATAAASGTAATATTTTAQQQAQAPTGTTAAAAPTGTTAATTPAAPPTQTQAATPVTPAPAAQQTVPAPPAQTPAGVTAAPATTPPGTATTATATAGGAAAPTGD